MTIKNLLNTDKPQTVFKYMDMPKFLSMITTNKLVFVKPTIYEDADECNFPEYTTLRRETQPLINSMRLERNDAIVDQFINDIRMAPTHNEEINIFREIFFKLYNAEIIAGVQVNNEIMGLLREYAQKLTEAFIYNDRTTILDIIMEFDDNDMLNGRNIKEIYLNNTYISCWHKSKSESDSMWKIYAQKNGVAIKTTTKKLENYLDFSTVESEGYEAKMDVVKYVNIKKLYQKANTLNSTELIANNLDDPALFFFRKKLCYSYEKEFRILFFKRPQLENSNSTPDLKIIPINTDLDNFIDKIIISPFAPSYYKDVIYRTLNNMGLKKLCKKIKQSNMNVNS